MDQLGIVPALPFDLAINESQIKISPQSNVTLHQWENALENMTAALYWGGKQFK